MELKARAWPKLATEQFTIGMFQSRIASFEMKGACKLTLGVLPFMLTGTTLVNLSLNDASCFPNGGKTTVLFLI